MSGPLCKLLVIPLDKTPPDPLSSWTVDDTNWPFNGEVDILEGWNDDPLNKPAFHMGNAAKYGKCTIDNVNQTGSVVTSNCDNQYQRPPQQWENQGCVVSDNNGPWGAQDGGVFAMEWTKNAIKLYTWKSGKEPANIESQTVDTSTWGLPVASLRSDNCDVDGIFKNQRLVLNIALCGDAVQGNWGGCAASTGQQLCSTYISRNPQTLTNAFFKIKDIRVFKTAPPAPTTTSTTSKVSSTSTTKTSSSTSTTTSKTSTTTSSTAVSTSPSSTKASSTTASSTTSSTTSFTTATTSTSTTGSPATKPGEANQSGTSSVSSSASASSSSSAQSSNTQSTTSSSSVASTASVSSASSVQSSNTQSATSSSSVASTASASSSSSVQSSVTETTTPSSSAVSSTTPSPTVSQGSSTSAVDVTSSPAVTSSVEMTTSTVYTTTVRTVTKCPPSVPCPTGGYVTTETIPLYTTVCPVTPTTTPAPSATSSPSAGSSVSASSSEEMTTSTVYTTTVRTVTKCPPTVHCPTGGYVTTETIPLYTTVCPVTATKTDSHKPTTPAQTNKPGHSQGPTTITTKVTKVYTITSCAPTVTNCPIGHVTTEVSTTTYCPGEQTGVPTGPGSVPVSSAVPVPPTSQIPATFETHTIPQPTGGRNSTGIYKPTATAPAPCVGPACPPGGSSVAPTGSIPPVQTPGGNEGCTGPDCKPPVVVGGAGKVGFSGLAVLGAVVAMMM